MRLHAERGCQPVHHSTPPATELTRPPVLPAWHPFGSSIKRLVRQLTLGRVDFRRTDQSSWGVASGECREVGDVVAFDAS